MKLKDSIAREGRSSKFYQKLVALMKDQFKETCSCGCNLQQDQWGTCIAPSYPKFAQATSRYSESFFTYEPFPNENIILNIIYIIYFKYNLYNLF